MNRKNLLISIICLLITFGWFMFIMNGLFNINMDTGGMIITDDWGLKAPPQTFSKPFGTATAISLFVQWGFVIPFALFIYFLIKHHKTNAKP